MGGVYEGVEGVGGGLGGVMKGVKGVGGGWERHIRRWRWWGGDGV